MNRIKFILLFLSLWPLASQAQQNLDSAKLDFSRKGQLLKDSLGAKIRRQAQQQADSISRIFKEKERLNRNTSVKKREKTAFQFIYSAAAPGQLSFKATPNTLSFLLKSNTAVKVNATHKTVITFDDQSEVSLNPAAGSTSAGNGMRFSSDLLVNYTLSAAQLASLKNKRITAVKLGYEGGVFTFVINGNNAGKIIQALAATSF